MLTRLSDNYNQLLYMPLMLVELVTMIFTLGRTFLIYKRSHGRKIIMSSLLDVIIRDNILYFVA